MIDLAAVRRAIDPDAPPTGDLRCPVHEDRHASLSVAIGKRGQLLCRCHAGCPQLEVFAEVRRRVGHLLNGHTYEAKAQPRRTVYEYVDIDGQAIARVHRTDKPNGEKTFMQSTPDGKCGWQWKGPKGPTPLYRLQALAASPTLPVVICEGEKAADAALQLLGAAYVATTYMGGAAAVSRADLGPLAGRDVIVWPDHDAAGKKAASELVARLQGIAARVRIVRVDDLPPKADAADVQWNAVEFNRRLVDPTPARTAAAAASIVDLMSTEFSALSWIVDDLIPEGTILLAGKPKSGKSWLILNVMTAAKLRLQLLHRNVAPVDGLYLALEDTPRRMQTRMKTLLLDCGNRVADLAGFEYRCDWPRGAEGAQLLDEYLAAHPNCRIAAVDVLAKIRPVGDRRGAYEQDYEAIAAWKAVADARRITLVIVHHTRKAEADDVFDEVSGTLAINGVVDQIIVLKRLPANPKQATLHMRGRDLPDDHELGVELRCGWWHLIGRAADVAASDARREVLEVLRDSDAPMTTTDLMKATGKRSRPSFSRLLSKMVEAQQLRRVGRAYAANTVDQ